MRLTDFNMLRVNNDELTKQKKKKNFNYDRSTYYRSLLVPLRMHRFMDLGREMYFLIIENKAYAGKEPTKEDEAESRTVVVSFFERCDHAGESFVVEPVGLSDGGNLVTSRMTPGELLRACGLYLEVPVGSSDRDVETLYENEFLENGLSVYKSTSRIESIDWAFEISGSVDVEDAFCDRIDAELFTKMVLARLPSKSEPDLRWSTLYNYSKGELSTMLSDGKGAGRGRGRGRGGVGMARGRGRKGKG